MQQESEVFVGLDTSKLKIAVALAEAGRDGEVRFLGDIANPPEAVRRLVTKLAGRYRRLAVCYEAGPTGYGLHRQVAALGHACAVIAPSLIPKRPGDRVKTNRRDAMTLARLHRAGELTRIWVPDPGHEAVRELVRAREAAMQDLRAKRQHLQSFLLRHGRIFAGRAAWTKAHVCTRRAFTASRELQGLTGVVAPERWPGVGCPSSALHFALPPRPLMVRLEQLLPSPRLANTRVPRRYPQPEGASVRV